MTTPPTLPSDRQLLDAARGGDDAAWRAFAARHRTAIAQLVGGGRSAERRADDVIESARQALLDDEPAPVGTPAIRAPRAALVARWSGGWFGPQRDDRADAGSPPEPPGSASDRELLAAAFATLPEPWQTALWHRYVDDEEPAVVAAHVGRPPDEVDELVATAERGLVDAVFGEYQRLGPFSAEAAAILPLLADHHHGTLDAADDRRVVDHLRRSHIVVAPPLPSPTIGAAVDGLEPPEPPVLAPPTLRHHDAADSRRLLELAGSIDRCLAPAVGPGIRTMRRAPAGDGDGFWVEGPGGVAAVTPTVTEPSVDEPAPSGATGSPRRRWIGIAAAAAIVVGAVVAVAALRTSSDASNTADPAAGPATDPPPTLDDSATDDEPAATDPDPGADPGSDPDTEPDPSTPTTSLALRPEDPGPVNALEIALDVGEPVAQGFAPTAAVDGLTLGVSSPAPVYAGGTATLDLALGNTTASEVAVGVTFTLPRGVRLDPSALRDCAGVDGGSVRGLVDVPAESTVSAPVRLLLDRSVVGRLEVDGDVVEPLVVPISVTQDLVHSSVGNGGVVVVGNTVTRCTPGPAAELGIDCRDVAAGIGDVVNRWDVPIEFAGRTPQFGLFNSSSADLVVPDGAEIAEAHLYWSGDLDERGATIPDDGRNTTIALGLPGGRVRTIEAGRVRLGDVDATQYLGSTEVTELVRDGGPGQYTVANIQTVEVQGTYGAWALVVVYDHPDEPRRHRLVTRPFHWVAPEDESGEVYEYGVDLDIPVAASTVKLDVVAFEGELGFEPEEFLVGGARLGGANPFDSSVAGSREPAFANSLGVDIDTYDLEIDASDGLLPIRATSDQDGIRIAVLALSVDLPT